MSEGCFGCGVDNTQGLHLEFSEADDRSAECTTVLPEAYAGEPGTLHGGIQATLLDEVLCKAAQYDMWSRGVDAVIVTASMELRYRAACPTEEKLTITGVVESIDWPSYRVAGAIRNASGQIVTEGTARWRVLGDVPAPVGIEDSR